MPDDDFEVVLRAWSAFSRVDLDAMIKELHPRVVAVPFGATLEGREYRGIEQVKRWWADEILATWDFFRVLVDGEPPGDAHGLDSDEQGRGAVAQQRLYQLLRQSRTITDRTFEVTFLASGVEAYVFTFG